MSHIQYIPKKALLERLEGAHADTVRKVIDDAYALAEAAHGERFDLQASRVPNIKAQMKEAVADRYGPQLVEIAKPLKALRAKVEDDRKANQGRPTPPMVALGNNLALADGALWSARKNLAPLGGVRVDDLEIMEHLR